MQSSSRFPVVPAHMAYRPRQLTSAHRLTQEGGFGFCNCRRKRYLTVCLSSFLMRQVARHSIVVALKTRQIRMPEKPSSSSFSHSTCSGSASAQSCISPPSSTPCSLDHSQAGACCVPAMQSQRSPLQTIKAFRSIRQRRCAWLMQDEEPRTSSCSHMLRLFLRRARSADRAGCKSASSAPGKAAEEEPIEISLGELLVLAGNTDGCAKESIRLLASTLLEPLGKRL